VPRLSRAGVQVERYRVVRPGEIVTRIEEALRKSSTEVLETASPMANSLELVCDAFTANEYRQGGRSPDEHRIQIKCGSESGAHATPSLWLGAHDLESATGSVGDPPEPVRTTRAGA
jgi:hypothetical protein